MLKLFGAKETKQSYRHEKTDRLEKIRKQLKKAENIYNNISSDAFESQVDYHRQIDICIMKINLLEMEMEALLLGERSKAIREGSV